MRLGRSLVINFIGQLIGLPLVVLTFWLLSDFSYGAIVALAVAYVVLLGFFGMRALNRKASAGAGDVAAGEGGR